MDIMLVTGPPCAGKTRYVREHKHPDDIVIDADLLAQALGSGSTHDHPGAIKALAAKLRDVATTEVVRSGRRAWIISASPTAEAQILHSDSVCIDPGIATCMARAEGRPHWTQEAIAEWYAKREPVTRRKTAATRSW